MKERKQKMRPKVKFNTRFKNVCKNDVGQVDKFHVKILGIGRAVFGKQVVDTTNF